MDGHTGKVNSVIEILQRRFGDRFTTNQTVRERHGTDESHHATMAPDAVVFPNERAEVQQIIQLCSEHDTPVIPIGVGTSLEGHITALRGRISLELSNTNSVLKGTPEEREVTD